jgi:hypothetical protein
MTNTTSTATTAMHSDKYQLIDVSHEIENGLVTYKGLPAPIICDYLSREASKSHYDEGTTFHIGKIGASPIRGLDKTNFLLKIRPPETNRAPVVAYSSRAKRYQH